MRRPIDNAVIGDGTAAHAARGVGPAQDYPCPVGTPVHAPFAAKRIIRWGNDDSDGGYALSGYADNGDFWVLQHLSEYRNERSGAEGDVVALSGDTGTQIWGAHLHHYLVLGGVRINPEDRGLYDAPAPADTGTARPLTLDTLEKPDMRPFILVHTLDGIDHLYLIGGGGTGVFHLMPEHLDVGGIPLPGQGVPGYWKLDDGHTLLGDLPRFTTGGNQSAFDRISEMYTRA